MSGKNKLKVWMHWTAKLEKHGRRKERKGNRWVDREKKGMTLVWNKNKRKIKKNAKERRMKKRKIWEKIVEINEKKRKRIWKKDQNERKKSIQTLKGRKWK